MKALTWHGIEDVRITEVPDPRIEQPTDAVVRVTSTAICGSDLHLYGVLAPYLTEGDILGHEFMGIVEEVGSGVTNLSVGDRVVVPFNISCGHCWMCDRGLFAQCETTQNVDQGKGASLFGYTSLYGAVPGGQAERVRVPHADFGPVKLPNELPDERFLYLSDILPTAWQGVEYAGVPEGGSLAVFGLGPVGQLAVRSALHRGITDVIAVDLVPERLELARAAGARVVDLSAVDDVADTIKEMTDGRGADSTLDAVGMEAHGNPVSELLIGGAKRLPGPIARKAIETAGIDRLSALHSRHHVRPPRRDRLRQRGLRRDGRPDADDADLRQGPDDEDGPVPREAVDRRAARDRERRRGRPRPRDPRDPPRLARRGARRCTRRSSRSRTAASRSSSPSERRRDVVT